MKRFCPRLLFAPIPFCLDALPSFAEFAFVVVWIGYVQFKIAKLTFLEGIRAADIYRRSSPLAAI